MDKIRTSLEIRAQWRPLLLLILIGWFLLSSAYSSALHTTPGVTGIDFRLYYDAASRLLHHQPLYQFRAEGDTYVYPPPLAIALQPLAALPYERALNFWFFLTASCLTLSVLLYAVAARYTWRDLALIGVILIIGYRFWPTTMNFALGQVNFFILLIVCAIYLADSRKLFTAISLLIACAALVKTWMIGLLIYPLLRNRWRAAALGAVTYAVLLITSFALVGWHEWHTFSTLTAGYANQTIGQIATTQSFPGFAYLHFGPNHHVDPLLASTLLHHCFILLGLAIIGSGFFYIYKNPPQPASYEARLQLGLVILSLLLLLPMCQSEYFVLCLPLLWTLLAPTPVTQGEPRLSLLVMAGSFAVYFTFTRSWPSPPIPEAYRHGLRSLTVSANFFAAFSLWLVTIYALIRTRFGKRGATQIQATALA